MSTEIAIPAGQEAEQRLPIGLVVSTGAPKPERGPGRPIDYFRFKDGDQDQYAEAAARARAEYGEQPKQLDDVLLLSNRIGDVLEIRVKAWRKSGLCVWGKTNLATIEDRDEFLAALAAWDDDAFYFPRELKDVPPRLREAWQGEPVEFKLDGPEDARIKKYEMHIEATLKFGLPRALGLGAVALYSTKSRKNIRNLYEGLWFAHRAFEGHVIGVPFRLRNEPRKTSYFHPGNAEEPKGYRSSSTFQVTFTTPFTMQEAIEAIRERHKALGTRDAPLALSAGEDGEPEFFRNDDRDQDEANDPGFIPVESFDPEMRDPDEPESVIEEGEYEEPDSAATDFEAMVPESAKQERAE
jgi:hypothetical protein